MKVRATTAAVTLRGKGNSPPLNARAVGHLAVLKQWTAMGSLPPQLLHHDAVSYCPEQIQGEMRLRGVEGKRLGFGDFAA